MFKNIPVIIHMVPILLVESGRSEKFWIWIPIFILIWIGFLMAIFISSHKFLFKFIPVPVP